MRLGTKVLLLTLTTTLGLSGVVLWVVTHRVTQREQDRARADLRQTVVNYDERLDALHGKITIVVQQLLSEPLRRSYLEKLESNKADDRLLAVTQFHDAFLGIDVTSELGADAPSFQVLLNATGQLLVASSRDLSIEALVRADTARWPYQTVIERQSVPRSYIALNDALYLAFGVPLRLDILDINEAPSHAYFAAYRVDDRWVNRLLRLARRETPAPLEASFMLDRTVVARGTSASGAPNLATFNELPQQAGDVEFRLAGERFVGRLSTFEPSPGRHGAFVVASSLDAALAGLRDLQRTIALVTAAVVLAAIVICRQLARRIARPVEQLVDATQRVSRGDFGVTVDSDRRDELGQLAGSFKKMAAGLEQRDLIKDTFGKFVDPKIVEGFLADPARLRLGGERRVQTILFSDLSNFTALSEKLTPEELVRLLNGYLGAAADVVAETHGILDKFIGDAVVAFWGPPLAERHAELACRAALRFLRLADDISSRATALGCPPVHVRVGVGTGEVLVGNIGSRSKYNYTVIGDVANLASRLESINKLYQTQVLATCQTVQAAGPQFISRRIDTVRVVGRREPVELYELLGEAGNVPDNVHPLCDAYAAAMQRYDDADWPAAAAAFDSIAERFGDGAARAMAGRCVVFMEREPGPEWDGIWRLDSK